MKLYKLLIPLLLLTVQGVAQQKNDTLMGKVISGKAVRMPINLSICEEEKLEIQTLRSLNDSLTRRLKEQIEYRAYASEIIKEIHAKVNKLGAVKIRIRSEWGLSSALFRYQKRYPELVKQ